MLPGDHDHYIYYILGHTITKMGLCCQARFISIEACCAILRVQHGMLKKLSLAKGNIAELADKHYLS